MMNRAKMTSTILALSLVWLAGGCNDGTRTLPGGYLSGTTGFGVNASSPALNATYVDRGTAIQIQFNEAVDMTSVPGNFTLMEYIGGKSTNVTNWLPATPQGSNSNSILIFTLTAPNMFKVNANYRLSLSSAIKSISGRTMVSMFELLFSTGAGNTSGYGQVNDPNSPPFVKSAQKDWFDGCLWVTVEFNEDLIRAPKGRMRATYFNNGIPMGNGSIGFEQTYNGENRFWSALISCDCDDFVWGMHYYITIFEALDTSEDPMSPESTHHIWTDYGDAC
jgi:hypothetical protein